MAFRGFLIDGTMSEEPNSSLTDNLLYGLSLPERLTRGLSAAVGGLVGETSSRLIPLAFRSSRSYDAFIQQSLDMLTHDVGGVQRPKVPGDNPPPPGEDVPLARKAVGGMLDIAGGATLHLSPITILAAINDIAYGSNVYLKLLAEELRRDGIIDEHSTINHVSDLIDVVAKTSNSAKQAAEAPPLDAAALRQTISQLREELSAADPTAILPQAELAKMWNDMQEIADASQLGLWQVGTAIGLHTIGRLDMAARGTLSSVRVAGNLFDQHVIDHYSDAISAIYKDGLYQTISVASQPYLDAVWNNFSPTRETWTSDLLTGKWFGKIFAGSDQTLAPESTACEIPISNRSATQISPNPTASQSMTASPPTWIKGISETIDQAELAADQLSAERVKLLDHAAQQIASTRRHHCQTTLSFICTHNSRRSHLAEVWATVAAAKLGLSDIHCVSGGTETTACNSRIIASLRRAGFKIETSNPKADNPTYQLRFADDQPPILLCSKRFQDATADVDSFVAMLCCSDADQSCPRISGANIRIALHYDDPKSSDDTAAESNTYDQRRDQIAAEMMHLMTKIARSENH